MAAATMEAKMADAGTLATEHAGARKVVVSQRFFDDEAIAFLRAHGCEPCFAELPAGEADGNVPPEVLTAWLQGASGWIVGHARVTRQLLAGLPDLQVVARRGVGFERVDTDAVLDLGRVATIAAGSNDPTVADLAVGLMLALGRRFSEGVANVQKGSAAIPVGSDLFGKTVGVVGLGRIGRGVVKRLRGFDTRVIVHDARPDEQLARDLGIEYADLPTLLAESDYVTLHAPLIPETRFLMRAETIALMKPTAFLINTARGGLVEDRDLLNALRNKQLAGAGLDVFVSESDPDYDDVTRELAAMPNVIGLPHVGASTHEALARMNMLAAQCVVAVLDRAAVPAGCIVADGRHAAQGYR